MILDCNFNKKIEPLINSSYALTDWFEKNQNYMAYFELTSPGCLHLEEYPQASLDIKVLGRMASSCLTWLETDLPYTDSDKVAFAIASIDELYNSFKDHLSDEAKIKYSINTSELTNNKKISKRR